MIDLLKLEKRLLRDCRLTIDGHILWTGAQSNKHGAFTFEGKNYAPHVVSAMLYLPNYNERLWTLHKPSCNIGLCIAPSHLYQGTHRDNCKDMVIAGTHRQTRKTHCPRGHEYTSENTRIHKNGARDCKKCAEWRHLIR